MRDLPIGIVTFLFTDIEGSTRLLERLGERYGKLQERHDAIIRAAIDGADGHEVGTEGDSFFAVFATPSGALRAAAQAQRELAATGSSDEDAVRVRMGVHTGEGVLGGDNYVGLDVNRAARIAAAAHGGQVLLSDATRAIVERSLPSGTELRDLGQHRLKDLLQPERLHQLVIEGLEQDFPSPRTVDARPNNLPAQLTRFIGRGDENARIRELLASHRLVTLTGPGGMGKTRLGLQVALDAMSDFRDGVTFVDLSAVTDSALVATEIADALQVRVEPGHAVLETLTKHLLPIELLLLLDNFEQVTDAGPSVVEPLLRVAPGVKALVTSRVPLHLYGEQEFQVPPLMLPDPDRLPQLDALVRLEAVALFVERAAARSPGFRVTAENARTVAEIAVRLDGLPLAIELAAGRAKLLSPEQLLARLEQRLPLLIAQERDVPERQRTLRRTIEWSYELLDEPERRTFSRMSVFAGGFDLEAVDVVANPHGELGHDSLDGLASLVDKNLVRSLDTGGVEQRFAMLETIREFGLERLAVSGEEPAVRQRHAEHWTNVGERASAALSGPEQAIWTRRLEQNIDNFRAALRWVVRSNEAELGLRLGTALRNFWRLGAHVPEGVRWLDEILAMPGATGSPQLRAQALTAAADLRSWTGETDEYLRLAEEAIATYRAIGDSLGIADALEEIGFAQLQAGLADVARTSLQEARELHTALSNPQKAGECSLGLGMVAGLEGRADQARERFEEALAIFKDLRDAYWTGFAERLVGAVDRIEGNDEAAEKRFRSSLIAAQRHDLMGLAASGLYAFADLALFRGQHERAIRLTGATDAIRERVGEAAPLEIQIVGDVRGAASSFLDEANAERLYQEGRGMEVERAVAYALQEKGT
jgi:predicted ATPase/class 3 adenylate cyclase